MLTHTEKFIQQSLRRIIAVFLVVGMNAAGLSAVGQTFGYYNDTERSDGNLFAAHMLDFRLEPNPTDSWRGDGTRTVTIADEGTSLEFDYTPYADNFNEYTTGFCDTLTLDVTHEATPVYSGALKDFDPNEVVASSTDAADWEFELTAGTSLPGDICIFDFIYDGWQEEMPGYDQGGYYDTEMVGNTILATSRLLITKVYFHPAPKEGGYNGEWVELYNDGADDINISGWQICDGYACDTIPSGSTVPADGFAIIVGDQSQVPANWHIPENFAVITLDQQKIGNGLNDDGDMLVLARPTVGTSTVAVDQVNWGVVNESGWDEHLLLYGAGVWNPGVDMSGEEVGDILARVPAGTDTDTLNDWTFLKRPDIELFEYEHDTEGSQEVWYWGYNYDIWWETSNPNDGDDTDLTVDLYYMEDTNQNEETDDAYEHVYSGGHDDLFNWTVPSEFLGYVWMKLVVTGPENPMAHNFTFTNKIYDPYPEGIPLDEPLMTPVPEAEPMPTMDFGAAPTLVFVSTAALGYSDMTPRVYNAAGDDMTVHTFVDGEEVDAVSIDTSVVGEYVITYEAHADGYVLSGTRLVVVYEGEEAPDAGDYTVPGVEIVPEEATDDAQLDAGSNEGSNDESGDTMTLGGDDTGGASDSDSGGDGGQEDDGGDGSDASGSNSNSDDSGDGAGVAGGASDDDSATASENGEDATDGTSEDPSVSDESDADVGDEETGESSQDEEDDNTDVGDGVAPNTEDADSADNSDDDDTTDTTADESSDEESAADGIEDHTSAGADEDSVDTGNEGTEENSDVLADEEEPAVKEEDEAPADAPEEQMEEEVIPEEPEQEEAPTEEPADDSPDDSSSSDETPDESVDLPDNGEETA